MVLIWVLLLKARDQKQCNEPIKQEKYKKNAYFFLIIICLFSSAGFDKTFLNPLEQEIDEKSCCHFGGVNYLKALI